MGLLDVRYRRAWTGADICELHVARAEGLLKMGASRTGKFSTAARIPSAMEMYQTMS